MLRSRRSEIASVTLSVFEYRGKKFAIRRMEIRCKNRIARLRVIEMRVGEMALLTYLIFRVESQYVLSGNGK